MPGKCIIMGPGTGRRPNKVHNTDIKLFLMCTKCCHPVEAWSGTRTRMSLGPGQARPSSSSECQRNRITSVCCGNTRTRNHSYTYIPQPIRTYSISPIQAAAQLQLHLDTLLVLVILCTHTPVPLALFPPSFRPLCPQFFPPNLLDFCSESSVGLFIRLQAQQFGLHTIYKITSNPLTQSPDNSPSPTHAQALQSVTQSASGWESV